MSCVVLVLLIPTLSCSGTDKASKGSEESITLEEAESLAAIVARAFIQERVPGTDYVIRWREVRSAVGPEPVPGSLVTVRFRRFSNFESEEIDGSEVVRAFKMGGDEVGQGIQVAVSSMQVGSIHEVSMREEVAGGIWKAIPPETMVHIRMELLDVSG